VSPEVHEMLKTFQWALLVLIYALFTLFAFKWYIKSRTRERWILCVGWLLGLVRCLAGKVIGPLYLAHCVPRLDSDPAMPDMLRHALFTNLGMVPRWLEHLVIGIGFTLLAIKLTKECRQEGVVGR